MYKVLEIAWNNDSSVLAVWSEELPSTEQIEEFVPKSYGLFSSFINPVNLNIVINILPTVLYTLLKMLTRRICSTTETLVIMSFILVIQGSYCKENLDAGHSWGSKGLLDMCHFYLDVKLKW